MAFVTAQPAASIDTLPLVWRSRPARMRSSVDLPQPEGPTMQRNSPGAIERSIPVSACTEPRGPSNIRERPAIAIRAPLRGGSAMLLQSLRDEGIGAVDQHEADAARLLAAIDPGMVGRLLHQDV